MEQDERAVWERVVKVAMEVFGDDTLAIEPPTTANDIAEWDSFRHLQLIVGIEKAFRVRFRNDDLARLACIGDFVPLVMRTKAR